MRVIRNFGRNPPIIPAPTNPERINTAPKVPASSLLRRRLRFGSALKQINSPVAERRNDLIHQREDCVEESHADGKHEEKN